MDKNELIMLTNNIAQGFDSIVRFRELFYSLEDTEGVIQCCDTLCAMVPFMDMLGLWTNEFPDALVEN